jgi:hypothetical protein
MLLECGALERLAEHVETGRLRLREVLGSMGPCFADWLEQVDQLASMLYEIPSPTRVARSCPGGSWREQVERALQVLIEDLAGHGAPTPPPRVMWSRFEWMFDGVHNVVFVPDLDASSQAILAEQAKLLGADDPRLVREWVERTLLLLLSHEYCHYWRFVVGRASTDVWYEEWAANRFAVATIADRHGDVLAALRGVFAELDAHGLPDASESAQAMLASLSTHDLRPESGRASYGMPLSDIAYVQLGLVRWLLGEELSFEEEVTRCTGMEHSPPALLGTPPMWEQLVVDVCEEAIAQAYDDAAWRTAIGIAVAKGKRTLLDLWLDLGVEAELPWDVAVQRAAACYLYYCHINLTDDMQDGDCDYLPPRLAPLVLVALTNLSETLRSRASVSVGANGRAAEGIARAIAAQYVECTHGIHDASSYLLVGRGIAGEQFASYFDWFLDGTRWERDAHRYGFVLGNLAHLQIDILTRDERFLALPSEAREMIVDRTARESLELISDEHAPQSVKERVAFLLAKLREAAADV